MEFHASTIQSNIGSLVQGRCRACGSELTHSVVDLGMSPLCEQFLTADELDRMEPYYPLHAFVCDNCYLLQLKEYVGPENIFGEYAYFSSYSTSWVAHAKDYCQMITRRLSLDSGSVVVEVASNDGYLLQHFGPLGVHAVGIEPAANVAAVAISKGIPTQVAFFGRDLAAQLAAEGKHADLIIGNNVLAQVPDLNDFVAGLRYLLKPSGIITLEFPHVVELLSKNQFDTIYHEHFSYFSLLTIIQLMQRHQLRVFDVEQLQTHGGSLRVYITHAAADYATASSVDAVIAEEIRQGCRGLQAYSQFARQVERTKHELLSLLISAKRENQTICGYGAPGKGNTLLNYCGVGRDFLDFTVDRNPYKHGRFTPGMHIPIFPVDILDKVKPDYILILPWNLRDEIVDQMWHVADWGAKFIIPIPHPMIVDPKGGAR